MAEPNPLYELSAQAYVAHADASVHNAGYERPALLAVIGDVSGLIVVDAGCAGGFYAEALSKMAERVIALDASEEMIRLVRARHLANVEARVADLSEPLGWISTHSVDVIVSSLALHYVANWESLFAEFRRVLRAPGRVVFSVHHPAMTEPLVQNYFGTQAVSDTWRVGGVDREVRFVHRSMEAIVTPVLEAGFTIARLIEPHLDLAAARTADERMLATKPWFLIIEANVAL